MTRDGEAETGGASLRGDILGGISAAIIALPLALGFGVAAYAPLGPEYASMGATAGMLAAIFTGIFAALFGGTPSLITGPTGPMTVVLTATFVRINEYHAEHGIHDMAATLTTGLLVVFLAGLVQVLLGAIRAGTVIKFIPLPVIAGFMNGIAVIIFLGQLRPILGVPDLAHAFSPNVVVLGAGLITIGAIVASDKLVPKLPASLVGLCLGTAAFFGLAAAIDPSLIRLEQNPHVVGVIPRGLPTPNQALHFVELLTHPEPELLRAIVPPALTLGVLGAIDSLLTSIVADVVTKTHHDSNRELIGQGIGNMMSAVFGGISGAGNTVETLVSINGGGRRRWAGVAQGTIVLLVLVVAAPIAGWIPRSVLAGVLIIVAVKMIDGWSLALLRKRTAIRDVIVIFTVMVITVAVDLMVAVAVGLLITVGLFVRDQISSSVIRRKFRCERRRSKRVRSESAKSKLADLGSKILVYELEGHVFFGTADKLARDVEEELQEAEIVVFDVRRVRTLDSTGAMLIKRMADSIHEQGAELFLSGIAHDDAGEQTRLYLRELGVMGAVGEESNHVFDDLDAALEASEDRLLASDEDAVEHCVSEAGPRYAELFEALTDDEFGRLEPYLGQQDLDAEEVMFRRGEVGGRLCVVLSGDVSVYAEGEHHRYRLASFGVGMHFGEMALLDDEHRTGTVIADSAARVATLDRADFERILDTDAGLGLKLLKAISQNLSSRLRATNNTVLELDA